MATFGTLSSARIPAFRASEGAGTTTLTVGDSRHQIFNLSAGRTCVLPSAGIKKGDVITLENLNDFLLTVQASNLSEITTAAGPTGNMGIASIFRGVSQLVANQDTPTTPAHWLTIHVEENGVYTPTLTNGANVQATTPYAINFSRLNTLVTVNGRIDVYATASGFALTVVDISLPKASNIVTQQDLAGVSVTSDSGVSMGAGFILGNTTSDRAILSYNSTTSINKETWFNFMYILK